MTAPETRPGAATPSAYISGAELMGELDAFLQGKKRPPLAVTHIELDHFDALVQRIGAAEAGRLCGDVAAHIVRLAGPQAKLSRHAGHIFIALLPTGAADIAESICRHIAAQAWPHGNDTITLTASAAMACVVVSSGRHTPAL